MTDGVLTITLQNLPLAFGIVFGTLMMLTGLLLAFVGIVTLWKWLASRHWPQVPASIVACEVREVHCFDDQLMFQPDVKYSFAAGSGEITGKDLAFAGKLYPTREQAEKAVSRYPVGMIVMARCNPLDPTQAVLVRRGGPSVLLLAGMGLAMIVGPLFAAQRAGLPAAWLGAGLFGTAGMLSIIGWWTGRRMSRARRAGIYPPPGRGSIEDVERLIRQGEKMLAIRLYREINDTDLKTSRQRVEEITARLRGG
jgi:hypothetical protein